MTKSTLSIIIAILFGMTALLLGQRPMISSSVDIYNKIEKLNVLGTVLYIAAHPDDENTRLISYFANERKVRTAYLSLTRGDGGQNLIGTEIWEKLGLIRTNELLMARSVDGGHQYFSRANDFGYSKHPDETLAFWNKDEVMHDIIKVIREFRPDIIVNRFDHRTPGKTHGHHTSSAMLSVEAFDIAGDASYDADRLSHLKPWQPERVFFNTSWWFYGSRENFDNADKANLYAADAGVYFPMRGISNTEIAARSRSMHKSQGFGSTGTRGSEMEYVELIKGSQPSNKEDPLSGLDLSWNRVKGGGAIEQKIKDLLSSYNFEIPSSNIPKLVEIHKMVERISDDYWKEVKLSELQEIIVASAGLYLEVAAKSPYAVRGENMTVGIESINRSDAIVSIKKVTISGNDEPIDLKIALSNNERKNLESTFPIARDFQYSNPYWLNKKGTMGMYHVEDPSVIGQPASQPAFKATFDIEIEGLAFSIEKDVVFKTNDPVDGEVYKPFYILPQASVKFTDPVYIFPDRTPKVVSVVIKSYKDDLNGVLKLDYPGNWNVEPQSVRVALANKGEERRFDFSIKGPFLSESAMMSIQLMAEDGTELDKSVTEIDYDHIPFQVLLSPAVAKFERISLETKGNNIAYLQGAGDDIPKSLRQIGYKVTEIEVADILTDKLRNFDALVMGIRAYNTKKDLLLKKDILMDYMNDGGTVIVQYNTSRGVKGDDIGPYPMELSRDRVTDETAGISFVHADHEILNFPNKISTRDFEGWVQERGLYFPNKWDEKYAAPLACSDTGEPLRQGGLLIAEVGGGHFIYTGYSWFRQLPAGVSGAFRLFANMLSIGKNAKAGSSSDTGSNE